MFSLCSPALLRLSNFDFRSFRRDADDTGILPQFGRTLYVTDSLQKTPQPAIFGQLWHNLRKWETSDTSQREQQSGTAKRDLGKTEKQRMDRSGFGVYV